MQKAALGLVIRKLEHFATNKIKLRPSALRIVYVQVQILGQMNNVCAILGLNAHILARLLCSLGEYGEKMHMYICVF